MIPLMLTDMVIAIPNVVSIIGTIIAAMDSSKDWLAATSSITTPPTSMNADPGPKSDASEKCSTSRARMKLDNTMTTALVANRTA